MFIFVMLFICVILLFLVSMISVLIVAKFNKFLVKFSVIFSIISPVRFSKFIPFSLEIKTSTILGLVGYLFQQYIYLNYY